MLSGGNPPVPAETRFASANVISPFRVIVLLPHFGACQGTPACTIENLRHDRLAVIPYPSMHGSSNLPDLGYAAANTVMDINYQCIRCTMRSHRRRIAGCIAHVRGLGVGRKVSTLSLSFPRILRTIPGCPRKPGEVSFLARIHLLFFNNIRKIPKSLLIK